MKGSCGCGQLGAKQVALGPLAVEAGIFGFILLVVLASTIAVQELFWAANLLEGETAKPFPIYTTLMVFYFIVIVIIARVLDRMYVKVAARGAA